MSIFAEKRAGRVTGRWIVEVMREGVKTRLRYPSHDEARVAESQLLAGQAVLTVKEAATHTLGWLLAQSGSIWEGCKDDQQAKRFEVCVGLLGASMLIRDVRTAQLDELKAKLVAIRPKRACDRRIANPNTIHRYLSAVSAALRWAHKRDIITGMPAIPWPKVQEATKRFFRPDEEAMVLKWMLDHGRTNEAICVRVLSQTGLRIGELLKLRPEYITNGYVLVGDYEGGTKTGDSRYVPIEDSVAHALMALIERGMPSYRMIWKALKAACLATGVDVRKTPHKLRHTTATRLMKAGVQPFVIQGYLGHANIATTQGYISVEPEDLKDAQGLLRSVEECGRNLAATAASVCQPSVMPPVENVENSGGLVEIRTQVQGFAVAKPLIYQGFRSTLRSHSVVEAVDVEVSVAVAIEPLSVTATATSRAPAGNATGNTTDEEDNAWVTLAGA